MSVRLRQISLLLAAAFTFWTGHLAPAQTLDDFKAAVDKDGCESIPYSDLRGRCNDKQQAVHTGETCDGKRSCRGLETTRFEKRIEFQNRQLNELKSQKDGFDSQKSEPENDDDKRPIETVIADIQTEIDALGNRIESSKKSIEDNKRKINDRIATGQKCRESREAVQDVFKDAMSKAKDESDADIKPLAEQLVSKWESSTSKHDDVIREVNDLIDKCKNLL